MLDTMRKGQRWLTWLFIVGVGGVFVFFMGNGGSLQPTAPSGNAVIQLDDDRIEISDYQRARIQHEQQMSESFGDQFDPKQMASFVDAQTLQSLISGAVLASSAEELGIRVSKQEVQDLVRSSDGFRGPDGRFDATEFKRFADWEYGSQRNFIRVVRHDLLRQKMLRLLYSQAQVSDAEAHSSARQRLEELRIAYVGLDRETVPEGVEISPEAIEEYLQNNAAELEALYQERIAEFQQEDRVHAWHILVTVESDADEATVEEARQRAEAALTRVRGGEDFAIVAQSVSEDPGTAATGGDLGFIARGEVSPDLEKAAFTAIMGAFGDLVRSDAGFHIVQVTESEEGGTQTFDEVKALLANRAYSAKQARERAETTAEELASQIRAGKSLEEAAAAAEVPLEQSVMIRRRPDGFIPGVGAAEDAMSVAFSLDMEKPSSDRIFEVDEKLVLIQLIERPEPANEELEDAFEAEKQRLLNEKRSRIVDEWVSTRRQDLVDAGRLLVNAQLVIGEG